MSYRLIKDKITEEEKRRIMEVIIDRICNNLDFNFITHDADKKNN